MTQLLAMYRPSKAERDTETCKNNRRQHDARTEADTNQGPGGFEHGRSDRRMLFHGGNILGQANHVPKLVAAGIDGSVRPANRPINRSSPFNFFPSPLP